jgi:cation diffusion facilitator family transporter
MADCGCEFEATNAAERKTLVAVLAINALMFVAEFTLGLLADSTGLMADSLDMLADAAVYAISLWAVGRSVTTRGRAALGSGIFQVLLAAGVLIDVIRRFIVGSDPASGLMMAVGGLALAANVACLALLAKHRRGNVNLRASWIFSTNDVIANVGIILAGGLVWLTGSRFPDLAIGLIVSLFVVWGGTRIIRDARRELRESDAPEAHS